MNCTKCKSHDNVKAGFKNKQGIKIQKYKCKICGREFTGVEKYHRLTKLKKDFIFKKAKDVGLRKTARLLGVYLRTIQYQLKQVSDTLSAKNT